MSIQSNNISLIKKLKEETNISNEFLTSINSLSLEDLIAVKLELAAANTNGRFYGFDLWRGIQHISKEALIKFALSATKSKKDAARFLGLTYFEFLNIYKRYNISEIFETKTNKELE